MGNNIRVPLSSTQTRLPSGFATCAALQAQAGCVSVLRGREAVIAMRPLLVELGLRTGQAKALDSIEYLVSSPTALDKVPTLVLVGLKSNLTPENATADNVKGVVLLYEYRVAGIGARIFATDDVTGHRTVIAPAGMRLQVAEAACRTLAERGGLMALISFEKDVATDVDRVVEHSAGAKCRIAMRTRTVARDLVLADSLDATLAALGSNTRRNFRRYRVRLETDLATHFVARVEISLQDFLAMNRDSTNPVSDAEAAWRHAYVTGLPGVLFAGVKAGDGRWLSLIGGRRHEGATKIEWQMNLAGLPRYSLSTVMRSYLLEHEIGLGTSKLSFQGGTPHAMGQSFLPSTTIDLLLVRRSLLAWMLHKLARWIFPKSTFIRNLLVDQHLVWTVR